MLLLDANLSWRMVRMLKQDFPGILHVTDTGLIEPSGDETIWNWAKTNGRTIVTNDEDFLHIFIQRRFPPRLILLKSGNQSVRKTTELLMERKSEIIKLHHSTDYGILEIY